MPLRRISLCISGLAKMVAIVPVSVADHQWESSLWAMSVAYSAFFQWDQLPQSLKEDIHTLLKAECNYELERKIPTGYIGDTKAEENGWEVDVLAAALGLFPTDNIWHPNGLIVCVRSPSIVIPIHRMLRIILLSTLGMTTKR